MLNNLIGAPSAAVVSFNDQLLDLALKSPIDYRKCGLLLDISTTIFLN